MQYKMSKAKGLFLGIAHALREVSIPQIWPVFYLVERMHLAEHGFYMVYDDFVAMRDGPVPLQTYVNYYQWTGRWGRDRGIPHPDQILMRSLHRVDPRQSAGRFNDRERQCIYWAVDQALQLGPNGVQRLAKDAAWEMAGPDGLMDPMAIASSAGADTATLDFILRWRDPPYLMEMGFERSAY